MPSSFDLSSLTTGELKLLDALTNRHAEAVREMARWGGVIHEMTKRNDISGFEKAAEQYRAALQHSRECRAAVLLLREELLRAHE